MGGDHWSDKGKNAELFNKQTAKDAELEKNKTLFREKLKIPEPTLELNPPWAGEADAAADRARREMDAQTAMNDQKKQEQDMVQANLDAARYQKQINTEKAREKQGLSERQEADQQTRRDALRTEAEQKRHQAQAVFADQKRTATQQSELDGFREQFRQAASPTHGLDIEIE